ncbi:hypothetical protein K490DRAFT_57033 [Saccharata proteae CBS 121410]|uniref:Homeobox domain-containing protein n=1 Tax=Saccharata proteae CBS 121410 TaxID=1314787 RepID=A0A9P4HSZ9_9PEZI|nr:hypothetical protein K490DRAFT_57033 [Saccharata proteae CBS 121410]
MSDPGSTPPTDTAKLSSPSSTSLAFLVHSPDTVQRNLPPDVDNKPLARQKRRRTSPEDQKILEAEYQRNPKPDKVARAEIVKRVALGEKEVQIWFQNRRQNSRRKSRPLEPHEIQSHLQSSGTDSAFLSSSTPHTDEMEEIEEDVPGVERAVDHGRQAANSADLSNGIDAPMSRSELENTAANKAPVSSARESAGPSSQTTEIASQPAGAADIGSSQPIPSSQEVPRQSTGYLANRRIASLAKNSEDRVQEKGKHARPSASTSLPQEPDDESEDEVPASYLANRRIKDFVRSFENTVRGYGRKSKNSKEPVSDTRQQESSGQSQVAQPPEPMPPSSSAPAAAPTPVRTLKKTGSFVRLSMTEDGKARVISNDESPSPPRSQPTPSTFSERSGGLRRSYSAAGLNESLKSAQEQSPSGLSRSFSGRSRDSRAWEFWCDSDARNSLTEKANQEGSGSAADAIELIRSTSRGALQSKVNKRAAQPLTQGPTKRQRIDGKPSSRQPLSRSSSSLARLQTKPQKKQDGDGFEIPQTESDKENWEPSGQHISGRRKLTTSQSATQPRRRILGENTNIMSQNSSLGSMMAREKAQKSPVKGRLKNSQSINPEDDEEVAAFMGNAARGNERTNVSSGEELGCVQGLLKLSQGNWR